MTDDFESKHDRGAGGKFVKMPRTETEVDGVGYPADVERLVPRTGELAEYYASTDRKHFSDDSVAGSKFTDPQMTKVEDVLALAYEQRGSLDGDDRDELVALGAKPEVFWDQARYLKVSTPGKVGSAPLSSFPEGTLFKAVRTKVGGNVSIVAEVDEMPTTDVGTIIIGRETPESDEVLFTTHPGLPAKAGTVDTFASVEGRTLTAAEVAAVAGTDKVGVNTVLRSGA